MKFSKDYMAKIILNLIYSSKAQFKWLLLIWSSIAWVRYICTYTCRSRQRTSGGIP